MQPDAHAARWAGDGPSGDPQALRKALDFFVEEHKAMEKIVETEG